MSTVEVKQLTNDEHHTALNIPRGSKLPSFVGMEFLYRRLSMPPTYVSIMGCIEEYANAIRSYQGHFDDMSVYKIILNEWVKMIENGDGRIFDRRHKISVLRAASMAAKGSRDAWEKDVERIMSERKKINSDKSNLR